MYRRVAITLYFAFLALFCSLSRVCCGLLKWLFFEKELGVQLKDAGNKLLTPPSSVQDLLSLLDRLEYQLSMVKQSPSELLKTALLPSTKALIAKEILQHSDEDVRVSVASCISQIMRISAPQAPYDEDQMKEYFNLTVVAFGKLSDASSHCYSKAVSILGTAAFLSSALFFCLRNQTSYTLSLSLSLTHSLMATVLRTPQFRAPPLRLSTISASASKTSCLSFRRRCTKSLRISPLQLSNKLRFVKFVSFASYEEVTETDEVKESEIEDSSDGVAAIEEEVGDDSSDSTDTDAEEVPLSPVMASLQLYKEALAGNDESKLAELEAFIKSIEDEKNDLERKVATLSEELSTEKARVLRISADFDNFRKRTERDRLSLLTNAQGEVVESLLPVLDNFERAKAQIKIETEGEEKINNSYQSIYKQFNEILDSLGVVPVETSGNPFDPLGSYQVGSKFSRVLDELFRRLNQIRSGFVKTLTRF